MAVDANHAERHVLMTGDPHDIQHGDTWEVRGRRATVVASNRWPPPKPGTHESDLAHCCACAEIKPSDDVLPGQSFAQHEAEAELAEAWSRANREHT